MKLNPDCVRDTLLAIESADYNTYISPRILQQELPQYSESEIEYTCLILDDGGFLIAMIVDLPGQLMPSVKSVIRLTYQGHELIAKIRDPERWPKLRTALSVIRDYSLSAISAIAEGATSAAINVYFSGQV